MIAPLQTDNRKLMRAGELSWHSHGSFTGGGFMQAYLWIGIGSARGGMARHWCNGVIMRMAGAGFPYGILTINVLGISRDRLCRGRHG